MITTTISEFRKDIKRYLDSVTKNFETLIINRGKDNGVVIMSLDEYNSLTSTQHELSSQLNEKRLDSAIQKLKFGESFEKNLLDKWGIYLLMNPGRIICTGRKPIRKSWRKSMSSLKIYQELRFQVKVSQNLWSISIKDFGRDELIMSIVWSIRLKMMKLG
jgi:antitoxin YefM